MNDDAASPRWILEYTLDANVLAEMATDHYRQAMRRTLSWWRLVIFTAAVCTSLLTLVLLKSFEMKAVIIASTIGLAFTIAFTFGGRRNIERAEKKYARYFRDLESAKLLGPRKLEIDAQQLSSTDASATLLLGWKSIRSIRPFEWRGDPFVGIHSSSGGQIIIPRVAFESDESYRAFIAASLRFQAAASPTAVRFDDGKAKGFPVWSVNE